MIKIKDNKGATIFQFDNINPTGVEEVISMKVLGKLMPPFREATFLKRALDDIEEALQEAFYMGMAFERKSKKDKKRIEESLYEEIRERKRRKQNEIMDLIWSVYDGQSEVESEDIWD